jgi:hypothetical protein
MAITSYAQTLRALGQAIEVAQFETFDLKSVGEGYRVLGEKVVQLQPNQESHKVTSLWKRLKGSVREETSQVCSIRQEIELEYSPREIDELEREGRARRRDPHGMPDAYTSSQVLRAAGAYLDRKHAKLQELSKRDGGIIRLRYETPLGANTEELTIAYLYDTAVRMYMKRSDRTGEEAVG